MTGRQLLLRLRLRTLALLCVLAGLAAVLEYYTYSVDDGKTITDVVNKAGRQRMYSQRIAFLADKYVHTHDPYVKNELEVTIDSMRSSHYQLKTIRRSIAPGGHSGKVIDSLFYKQPDTLDRHVNSFLEAAQKLVSLPSDNPTVTNKYVHYIGFNAQGALLKKLEKAVSALSTLALEDIEEI